MENRVYDLSCIMESKNNSNDFEKKSWLIEDSTYKVYKYVKSNINLNNIYSLGLARSLIFKDDKLICFSPPKSIDYMYFKNNFDPKFCYCEEFIEGTMINLFYDNTISNWQISTKSSVGANFSYIIGKKTFSELFYETLKHSGINLDSFNKEYCYSLVIQHPDNKFIIPVTEKKIYVIAIYKIDDNKVTEIGRNNYHLVGEFLKNLYHPSQFAFQDYESLEYHYGSNECYMYSMGIIIKTTSGVRTKIRNPNYEYLKQLKGNSSKNQFSYYLLRYNNKLREFLNYFPEYGEEFRIYRNQVHHFTSRLHEYYISCYIKKENPLTSYPPEYRTHMYNLHQIYLEIRVNKEVITAKKVQEYVNKIQPPHLMYAINYNLRKKNNSKNIESENSELMQTSVQVN